jgi:alkylation response protein AidB-like acyl-CoA dehydrogenase
MLPQDDDGVAEALLELTREIAAKELAPLVHEAEERGTFPEATYRLLGRAGLLSLPFAEEYGGGAQPYEVYLQVVEEIATAWPSVGVGVSVHGLTANVVATNGSDALRHEWLPRMLSGDWLGAYCLSEPQAGSDVSGIRTRAVREGDEYIVNGGKIYTSRFHQTDLMLLLVRTERYEDVEKKTDGITVLLVDVREAKENGQIEYRPIKVMSGHHTNQLSITNLRVPVENRIGEEGKGFKVILSGMNSERLLVSSEYIGSGLYFVDRAVQYAKEREVFGRPIGMNQGIQFPLATSFTELRAASMVRWHAAKVYQEGSRDGFYANTAKLLSSKALWNAANAAMDTFGGAGLASEYGIEQKFRAARGPLIAPISTNLVLAGIAHRDPGLPKSF